MPIPQHVIEQVRDRNDVVEVVGQYVDLKRAGTNYKVPVPPGARASRVSPEKQIFHCFGCRAGNVSSS